MDRGTPASTEYSRQKEPVWEGLPWTIAYYYPKHGTADQHCSVAFVSSFGLHALVAISNTDYPWRLMEYL